MSRDPDRPPRQPGEWRVPPRPPGPPRNPSRRQFGRHRKPGRPRQFGAAQELGRQRRLSHLRRLGPTWRLDPARQVDAARQLDPTRRLEAARHLEAARQLSRARQTAVPHGRRVDPTRYVGGLLLWQGLAWLALAVVALGIWITALPAILMPTSTGQAIIWRVAELQAIVIGAGLGAAEIRMACRLRSGLRLRGGRRELRPAPAFVTASRDPDGFVGRKAANRRLQSMKPSGRRRRGATWGPTGGARHLARRGEAWRGEAGCGPVGPGEARRGGGRQGLPSNVAPPSHTWRGLAPIVQPDLLRPRQRHAAGSTES